MGIRGWILRGLLRRGEFFVFFCFFSWSGENEANKQHSFGWVNASYVYGMQICNVHMRRALGTCTPYETYHKMTEHGL
jgi:hypothetical protein